MKDLFASLYQHILNDEEIKKAIKDRLYPVILPEDAPNPAIVYTPIFGHYGSALQHDTGFARQTVQFVVHASSFKEARILKRLLKKSLQDYKGYMGDIFIEATFIKSDYTYSTNTSLKFSTEEFCESIEFEFYYQEEE